MTAFTNETGTTNPTRTAAFKFGPYLPAFPKNQINGKDTVLIIANGAAVPAPTGAYGWIYKPETEEIYADLTGVDPGRASPTSVTDEPSNQTSRDGPSVRERSRWPKG